MWIAYFKRSLIPGISTSDTKHILDLKRASKLEKKILEGQEGGQQVTQLSNTWTLTGRLLKSELTIPDITSLKCIIQQFLCEAAFGEHFGVRVVYG